MNRQELLRRAAGAVFGLTVGRHLDLLPAPAPVVSETASFVFVDGGSLELGIVRDSLLRGTESWQMFGETFENVARIGPGPTLFVTAIDPMRRDPREVLEELRAVCPDEHALLTEQIVLPAR